MSRSMYQFTPEILEFKNMEGKLMVLYDLGAQTAQSSVLPASKQKKNLSVATLSVFTRTSVTISMPSLSLRRQQSQLRRGTQLQYHHLVPGSSFVPTVSLTTTLHYLPTISQYHAILDRSNLLERNLAAAVFERPHLAWQFRSDVSHLHTERKKTS